MSYTILHWIHTPSIKVIVMALSHLHYMHTIHTIHLHTLYTHFINIHYIYTIYTYYMHTVYTHNQHIYTLYIHTLHTHYTYNVYTPYTHIKHRCQELHPRVHDPEVVRPGYMGQRARVYTQPGRVTRRYIYIYCNICVYVYVYICVYTCILYTWVYPTWSSHWQVYTLYSI